MMLFRSPTAICFTSSISDFDTPTSQRLFVEYSTATSAMTYAAFAKNESIDGMNKSLSRKAIAVAAHMNDKALPTRSKK